MTRDESIFLGILVVNLVLAVIYLLYGILFAVPVQSRVSKKGKEGLHDGRGAYVIRFFVMLLCPVVGFVFFFVAQLLYKTVFRFGVNLDDVTFSKERVDTQVKADEEQGRNIIPIEEALAVNDNKSLRTAMLSIIRGEVDSSLSSIAMALKSGDSETAHYAASILSDRLNEFRMNVRKRYAEIQENPERTECAEELIDYMNGILKQKIFTKLEQNGYVRMMAEVADILYQKDASRLTLDRYEGVCLRLMEEGQYDDSEKWCLRVAEKHPEALCAYTCRLKLYFTQKNRDAFFQTLDNLKKTEIVIDNETLEMIRIFS